CTMPSDSRMRIASRTTVRETPKRRSRPARVSTSPRASAPSAISAPRVSRMSLCNTGAAMAPPNAVPSPPEAGTTMLGPGRTKKDMIFLSGVSAANPAAPTPAPVMRCPYEHVRPDRKTRPGDRILPRAGPGPGPGPGRARRHRGGARTRPARTDRGDLRRRAGRQTGPAPTVSFDVTVPSAVEQGVDELIGTHGVPDVLVNNAGIQRRAPFNEFAPSDWDAVIAGNLSSAFYVSRRITPGMAERG